ncbi:hypothetical protein GN956_G12808 [Arapaima gigas]
MGNSNEDFVPGDGGGGRSRDAPICQDCRKGEDQTTKLWCEVSSFNLKDLAPACWDPGNPLLWLCWLSLLERKEPVLICRTKPLKVLLR